jgi:crossover junction endodeoxyribonuclease RusA
MTSQFVITRPPSVNSCYGNRRKGQKGRGRFISPELRRWRKTAEAEIRVTGYLRRCSSPVSIEIWASEAGMGRKIIDADGFIKPVLDLLVACEIVPDDRRQYVRSVRSQWCGDVAADMIRVEITELEGFSEISEKPQKLIRISKASVMKQLKKKFGIDIDPSRVHVQGSIRKCDASGSLHQNK